MARHKQQGLKYLELVIAGMWA